MVKKFRQRLPCERLPLSPRQSRLYEIILESYTKTGKSMSYQKMGYMLNNISRIGIWYHVNELEYKGWIARVPHATRSLIPLPYLEEILDKEGLPDLSIPGTD